MDSQFTLFLVASIALIMTPGQDTIYVITRGIGQGKVAGVISALGVNLGVIIHTLFAVLGLSAILQSSALAFTVIKMVGAVYLIYLGIKTVLNKKEFFLQPNRQKASRLMLLWQGFVTNVLNPKVALFFLAFLPQFVDPSLGNVPWQMFLMGLCFALLGVVWLSCVGYFAGSMGSWIGRSATASSILRWITSSVLIGLGIKLALPERR
ncbi:Threonine efflux protein [Hyella patelloides LEGE 07179]|uniref:Threonine efflux protein n=1 Tax=Hyella patelloides LEGE 07179 TaxID=945734 RepID=A0A563VXB3_9CYAN|nr:LysE family translocator [Hyella patelloides]VEP16061.1 Threonine efflux protein [Hyella patelloides LEGE 07179]